MSNNVANFPDQLLEQSLRIKDAARQLVAAQLNGVPQLPPDMPPPTEDEMRTITIHMKRPEERTASDFLFLMSELSKHSSICADTRCFWKQKCWRMKGLLFHAEKLRKRGRETPTAMAALWNRHLELEMHIESCQAKEHCVCMNLEHYKYFLMKCLSDLRSGKIEPVASTVCPDVAKGVMNPKHVLFPVLVHFKEHLAKRPQHDPTKRSAVNLLYKIATNDFGSEADKKERAAAAAAARHEANAKAVAAAAAVPGRKLMARLKGGKVVELEQDADGGIRVKGDPSGVRTTLAELSQKHRRELEKAANGGFDPLEPGCSKGPTKKKEVGPAKMWAGLLEPGCDHNPDRQCHCTFNERVVDVNLGKREPLVRNKNHMIAPSEAVLNVLRDRIVRLVEARGTERYAVSGVRVVTCAIYGNRWTVAFNADVHNNFSESQYAEAVAQYMFAAQFYRNTQVLMYNFVTEKSSEGAKRLEDLLRDVGTRFSVTANLNYVRPSQLEVLPAQLASNHRVMLQRGELNKKGTLLWYSGAFVRVNNKVVENVWRDYLEKDRAQFKALVDQYSKLTPPKLPCGHKTPVASKNQSEETANSITKQYVNKKAESYKELPQNGLSDERFAKFQEGWKAMAQQGGTWDKTRFLDILKTDEAREFCLSGKFPRDAAGKEYIPHELFAMCTPRVEWTKPATGPDSVTKTQAAPPTHPPAQKLVGKPFGSVRSVETGKLFPFPPPGELDELAMDADVIRELMAAERKEGIDQLTSQWIRSSCVKEEGSSVTRGDLYAAYVDDMRNVHHSLAESLMMFTNKIKTIFPETDFKLREGDRAMTVVHGLRLINKTSKGGEGPSKKEEKEKNGLEKKAVTPHPANHSLASLQKLAGKPFGSVRSVESGSLYPFPDELEMEADAIRELMEAEMKEGLAPLDQLESDDSIDFPSMDSDGDEHKDDGKGSRTDSLPDVDDPTEDADALKQL